MPSYDPNFFNINPYYDDFDESKKFLKLLFKPGLALQARELSQIQSILQNQLERFGNFVLDDGSMVYGGQITEIPVQIITMTGLTSTNGTELEDIENKVISLYDEDGLTSYAKIIHGSKNPITNEDVIFYQYVSGEGYTGSAVQNIQGFNEGITFTASTSGAAFDGLVVSVDEGIRYTNGFFVLHDAQKIGVYEVDEESNTVDYDTPNSSVGFEIRKNIITSEQDITLRDPASGFYNFNAPGSDRFKIDLVISQRSLTASVDTAASDIFSRVDFIEFLRVVDGDVIKKEKYPTLGEIEETFARRTYDESGHYIVDPFEISTEPHSSTQFKTKLESGKAYVFGYEFETIGNTKLTHEKAREFVSVDDVEYGYSIGPFVVAKFSNIDDGASGFNISDTPNVLFDSYSGFENQNFTLVDGVRFDVGPNATTRDFIPGLTLYFADNPLDLTGGDGVLYPGASAGIQAKILRVIPLGGETSQQYTPQGHSYITSVEIGPPYITGNNWSGGVTSSFQTTSPFYVAAGPSFEAGENLVFTGSNVSFFSTIRADQFTGGNIETQIASAKIRNIQKLSGSFFKLFLDDLNIEEGKTISETKRIYVAGNTGNPAFYAAEVPTKLYNIENTSLVFESPFAEVVRSVDEYNYMIDVTLENVTFGDAPASEWEGKGYQTTLNFSGLKQIGPNISDSNFFYDSNSSRIVSVFCQDGKIECEIKISGGTNPKTLTIQNAKLNGLAYSGTGTIVVSCQVGGSNNSVAREKTSVALSDLALSFTGPDEMGYYYSYFVDEGVYLTDVYSINSVTPSLTGYVLDTGQKNTYYDFSKIKIKSSPPEGLESYTANISYFSHSGYGPFAGGTSNNESLGSYPNYEEIPSFETTDGKTISLRNSLDFRAVRIDNPDTFTLTGPYQRPSYIYDGYEHSVNYSYYLPRIDKIILTRDKTFQVIQGIPNENPVSPSDDPNAMTLYTIRVNPYTFDENDVSIAQEDNRRFTMRDIGNLERRIEKLEYYSTLSLLEQEAKNTPIYDDFGLEMPKKAILVDQFTGTESADVSNSDFYCSINKETKELRPPYENKEIGYEDIKNNNSGYVIGPAGSQGSSSFQLGSGLTSNDGIVTYDFDEEELIKNSKQNSKRFINSNSIVDFIGTIKLTPHCDSWFSTEKKPAIKSNSEGENDSWLVGSPSFQMNSDFWEYGWFGRNISSNKPQRKNTELKRNYTGKGSPTSKIGTFTVPQSNTSSSVDRIVDKSVVPYCRSKTIQIQANGLKPNKVHHIYFDDQLIDSLGITSSSRGEISYSLSLTGNVYQAGKKLVRIIDNNGGNLANSTSSADAVYMVSGTSKDPESIRSTRQIITRRESSNSENITSDALTRDFQRKQQKSKRSKDNIAQIFTVNKNKYSSGIYINSVDIYFSDWPSAEGDIERDLPVKLLLKPLVNGYPSPSKIIAESVIYDVETTSGTVNSSEGYKIINFKFSHPIYLEPSDYCLELETNSSNYSIKTYVLPSSSKSLGENERENVVDVNLGSLILPKNVGGTEKLNNEIMTFKLNKCKFKSGGSNSNSISYPVSNFNYPSEVKTHIEGSFIDSRYCRGTVGSSSLSVNTSEKLKNVSSVSEISIDVSFIDENTSPAIDLRASNIVLTKYKTSNTISNEKDPSDVGSDAVLVDGKFRNVSSSKYITKTVSTIETAKNVSVVFDRNQPPGTEIYVYLKKAEPNSTIPFDENEYIELFKISRDQTSSKTNDFVRTEYRSPTDLKEFNTFAVKIVFVKPQNSSDYPSIKNLKVTSI